MPSFLEQNGGHEKTLLISHHNFFALPSYSALPRKLGVGVILGDPTGLSAKYFFDRTTAAAAGLSFDSHYVLLFEDFLWHFPGSIRGNNDFVNGLNPYLGLGPILVVNTGNDDHDHNHHYDIEDEDENFALGARIPLGIEWLSKKIPIGVSLEIVPGMAVIPRTDAFLQGGLGIRYYF